MSPFSIANTFHTKFQSFIIPSGFTMSSFPLFQSSISAGLCKGAALIHGARYGNVPAMSPGNGPCQAEAQPVPAWDRLWSQR